jgi:hypothetical protein
MTGLKFQLGQELELLDNLEHSLQLTKLLEMSWGVTLNGLLITLFLLFPFKWLLIGIGYVGIEINRFFTISSKPQLVIKVIIITKYAVFYGVSYFTIT